MASETVIGGGMRTSCHTRRENASARKRSLREQAERSVQSEPREGLPPASGKKGEVGGGREGVLAVPALTLALRTLRAVLTHQQQDPRTRARTPNAQPT